MSEGGIDAPKPTSSEASKALPQNLPPARYLEGHTFTLEGALKQSQAASLFKDPELKAPTEAKPESSIAPSEVILPESIVERGGHHKGVSPSPEDLKRVEEMERKALASGLSIPGIEDLASNLEEERKKPKVVDLEEREREFRKVIESGSPLIEPIKGRDDAVYVVDSETGRKTVMERDQLGHMASMDPDEFNRVFRNYNDDQIGELVKADLTNPGVRQGLEGDGLIGFVEELQRRKEVERNSPEYIWSPEFKAEGIEMAFEIVRLEGESYEDRYDTVKHPPKDATKYDNRLDEVFDEWKAWVRRSGQKSYQRKPFKPSEIQPQLAQGNEASPAQTRQEEIPVAEKAEPDSLEGLRPVREIMGEYNRLRLEEPDNEVAIADQEKELSRYFKEVKRLGLLTAIDSSLGSIYVEIMKGLSQNTPEDQLWEKVEQRSLSIHALGERIFRATRKSDREFARQRDKTDRLDEVWEVYTELAVDRFSLLFTTMSVEENGVTLIKSKGVVEKPTIDGEFAFNINDVTFGTDDKDTLRELVPSDAQLAGYIHNKDVLSRLLRRLTKGDEAEYSRLMADDQAALTLITSERDETYTRLVQEREGAVRNLTADREAFRQLSEDRELYWKPTYANYFEVTARTEEQFQMATDTFVQWLRNGLTKSPNEIFQRVNGFKDALTTAGQRERAGVRTEFMIGLRQELEGLVGISGADWANEHYNVANYKQFLEFVAQDEGPARFLRLFMANEGGVASMMWKMDHDPRLEVWFSTHASRGQLAKERSPVAQEALQDHIKEMMIFETMGVAIKSYHPDDSTKESSRHAKESNLNDLTRFKSDDDFKNLYEGFDRESQQAIYGELAPKYEAWVRSREISAAINKGLSPDTLQGADKDLYLRMQHEEIPRLKPAEEQYIDRLIRLERMREQYEAGKFDSGGLRGEDQRLYENARNAVTLALEMYGVMGTKAKRGGGVFLVDRVVNGKKIVDYIPAHKAEKHVQFAENWVRDTYGGELDPEVARRIGKKGVPAAELKYMVDQARRMAIWSLKTDGFDAKLYDYTLTVQGVPIDPNTLGYSKYGQDSSKSETILTERVDRFRYAPPENPRIVGYTSEGKPVIITFNSDGRLRKNLWDKDGKPYNLEFDRDGLVVYADSKALTRIKIADNLNENSIARQMVVKSPKVEDDEERVSVGSPRFKKVAKRPDGSVIVEAKAVDFDTAVNHVYSRWSGHAYWGYQEQDTQLLLEAMEDADLVKKGLARLEDVKPHAAQVLVVDPSLNNVGRFWDREAREDKIVLAAVEGKYLSHWRITNELHQAFYAEDASDEYNRTAYNLQDFGGSTKMWQSERILAMRWTDALARRARTIIPVFPLHFASMEEMWGAGTATEVFQMMGYGQYRMVGQFALEKWIGQTEAAQDLFEAIHGYSSPQEKRDREGYAEKPTDDADVLQKVWNDVHHGYLKDSSYEDKDNEFINTVRKTRGRSETVQHRIRVLETAKRGERSPQWLEGIDIYQRNADGSIKRGSDGQKLYNTAIDARRDSGSSRHSGTLWFWEDVRWLRSRKPGEGRALYRDSAKYYAYMDEPTAESNIRTKAGTDGKFTTRWEWLLSKQNR